MRAFVDTSAFLALIDAREAANSTATKVWHWLLLNEARLICTNYVLLEALALIQNRLGMAAVRDFQENVLPLLTVEWIDSQLHQAGMSAVLTANRRSLSLVDCVSFEVCRRVSIDTVFAFDHHFVEQGFAILSLDS